MLIEMKDNYIYLDKKAVAENFRINILAEQRQLRMKVNLISADGSKEPIDIVIFKWTPCIDKFKPTLNIDGKDMLNNKTFNVTIKLDLIKKTARFTGTLNNREIDINIDNIKDSMEILNLINR